jgi:hypothetical protein
MEEQWCGRIIFCFCEFSLAVSDEAKEKAAKLGKPIK